MSLDISVSSFEGGPGKLYGNCESFGNRLFSQVWERIANPAMAESIFPKSSLLTFSIAAHDMKIKVELRGTNTSQNVLSFLYHANHS